MKYLAMVMRLVIMIIGVFMMYHFPDMTTPPFLSGMTFVLISIYLSVFGRSCMCACKSCEKTKKKEKKKDKKKKKDKYEGNY